MFKERFRNIPKELSKMQNEIKTIQQKISKCGSMEEHQKDVETLQFLGRLHRKGRVCHERIQRTLETILQILRNIYITKTEIN